MTYLALAGTIAMLGVNGWRLNLTNDVAYGVIVSVATGELVSVDDVAEVLRAGSEEKR